MSKLLCLLAFLLGLSYTYAQVEIIEFENDDDPEEEYEEYTLMQIAPYRIGYTPSSILNPFPSLQISQDFKVNEFTEFSLETGFVFTSGLYGKGFRVRASLEPYLYRWEHVGFYMGVAATNVSIWEYVNYTIEHENAYFREYDQFRSRVLVGGYLTGGFKYHLGRGVMLETSAAMGLASLYNDPLENAENAWIWTFWPSDPGWNPLFGFYTNLNISVPVNIDPVKQVFAKKKKKKKRKKRRRSRRR